VLGEDHPETVTSMLALASSLRAAGKADEALPLVQRAVTLRDRQYGPDHQATLAARAYLAQTLRDLGRTQDALDEMEKVIPDLRRSLGEKHLETLQARMVAIELRTLLGRCDGLAEEAEQVASALPPTDERFALWRTMAQMERSLASACTGLTEPAEQGLMSAYADFESRGGPHNRFARRAAELLAWLYGRAGREADAALWRTRAAPPPTDDE
jgi:hypothetical protein